MEYHNLDSLKLIVENVVKGVLDEADFGANVKGDLTEDDILKGEVVYHRPADAKGSDRLATIKSLMKYGFDRDYTSSNGGNMLGIGIYSVYNLRSSNEKARGYGHYIVKAYVLGGFKDFLILNEDIAKKYYGKNYWVGNQIKMLMPEKLANSVLAHFGNRLYMNNNETATSKRTAPLAFQITDFLGSKIEQTKIRGIIYSGGHDGDCAFIRNFKDAIPYAYSSDNGRTWTKAITDELIWRAGHDTDVEATLRNTVDDKGKKVFDNVAARAINGYAIVYKGDKANYFNVAKNDLIGDVWFDYAGNFDKSMDGTLEAEVSYNDHKLTIYEEDGKYIVADEYGCPICYLNDLPKQSLNESYVNGGLLTEGQLVDNFDLATKIMHFDNDDAFYYVFVIKRKKDNYGQHFSRRGPDNRSNCIYLKSWTIMSPQELMSHRTEIINLCNRENARAYITINPRSMKRAQNYVDYCKRKGMFKGREFEHAAGQIKSVDNDGTYDWATINPMSLIDMDITEPTSHKEFEELMSQNGLTPVATYSSPNYGKHYIMPDRKARNLDYSSFEKYRPNNAKRRRSDPMVEFKADAPMILYSNV